MARNVADAAALFAAIDGSDSIDPRQGWCVGRDTVQPARNVGSLRLAILDQGFALVTPVVAAAATTIIERAERAGASFLALEWQGFDEALHLHLALYLIGDAATGAGHVSALAASAPQGWAEWRAHVATPPLLDAMHEAGRTLAAYDPGLDARAMDRALLLAIELDALLADHDALLLPTTTDIAQLIPADPAPDQIFGDTRLTAAFNVTGHPAVSIPCGLVDDMPVGLQLVGKRGEDFALLAVAAAIETMIDPLPRPSGDFGKL
jgi:amidase